MSTLKAKADARAVEVLLSDHELTVRLADGRTVTVPLAWFPRLLHATPVQRSSWELLEDGEGIHWPEVDEDISVEGLLAGNSGNAAPSR